MSQQIHNQHSCKTITYMHINLLGTHIQPNQASKSVNKNGQPHKIFSARSFLLDLYNQVN